MGIELPFPHEQQPGSNAGSIEYKTPQQRSETLGALQTVETNATESPSSQEVRTGQGAGDSNGPSEQSAVNATTSVTLPIQSSATSLSLDDVPVVAADEDLIEKQWVDSVKRIIKDTRNDPYKQGQAISRLQADYLQKRYGKTIGEVNP